MNVDDRIVLNLTTQDDELQKAIREHENTIKTETLAVSIAQNDGYTETVLVENAELLIQLERV